jgi:hypothetical protein
LRFVRMENPPMLNTTVANGQDLGCDADHWWGWAGKVELTTSLQPRSGDRMEPTA